MSLKKFVDDLLKEVHEAHTKVDSSGRKKNDRTSAYSLFVTWPKDIELPYAFYITESHTHNEWYRTYPDTFRLIEKVLVIAEGSYDFGTRGGYFPVEDKDAADGILTTIRAHLNTAKTQYRNLTFAQFQSELAPTPITTRAGPNREELALPHALAQLKALSAPCQGCDCNCACAACTAGASAPVIRKKPQAGCRCKACCERSYASASVAGARA